MFANCTARHRRLFALVTDDAAGCAKGTRATGKTRLLCVTRRRGAGCDEIGERAEELVGAGARDVCCSLPENRGQANGAGPFIGAAIGAEPMVIAAGRRAAFVMADLVGDGDGKAFWADVAMARKAAIDPDMGRGRPQPERLGVQTVALPRNIDCDVVE